MAREHTELINQILVRLSQKKCRAWKNTVGVFHLPNGKPIRIGVVGSSDIFGIRWDGKFISIEVKIGNDVLKERQCAWRDMIRAFGGLWCEARCVDDVEQIFKD